MASMPKTLTVSGYGRRGKFCHASTGGVPCREEASYWVKLTIAPIATRVCIDCAARMRKDYPDMVESLRTYRPHPSP
jgi:hypothetical protein